MVVRAPYGRRSALWSSERPFLQVYIALSMLRETNDQDPYNLTLRGSKDQSPNNWRRLWKANKSLGNGLQGPGFNEFCWDLSLSSIFLFCLKLAWKHCICLRQIEEISSVLC